MVDHRPGVPAVAQADGEDLEPTARGRWSAVPVRPGGRDRLLRPVRLARGGVAIDVGRGEAAAPHDAVRVAVEPVGSVRHGRQTRRNAADVRGGTSRKTDGWTARWLDG